MWLSRKVLPDSNSVLCDRKPETLLARRPSPAVVSSNPAGQRWRVALVGTGNIAETHAAVLSELPDTQLAAVVDVDGERATRFAQKWGIPKILSDSRELTFGDRIAEVAHVLVPPPAHMPVSSGLLEAGVHVFLEKPMAQSGEECEAILASAQRGRTHVAVNHNFSHHPAHRRALGWVAAGKFGRLRHVTMVFNMPLRQLAARQLGHWMFDSSRNLLLEQAVHPLSLIDDLIGPITGAHADGSPAEKVAGHDVVRNFAIVLRSHRATAQLQFALGATYPMWRATLVCDDGAISIDYLSNRIALEETRSWRPPFSDLKNGIPMVTSILAQDFVNSFGYVLSTLKLRSRSDYFFRSMRESIRSFYTGLAYPETGNRVDQAIRLVRLCSDLGMRAGIEAQAFPTPAIGRLKASYDVAVIGGTGFIGQSVVAALIQEHKRVGVFARNTRRLPPLFNDPDVVLIEGDATRYEDVRAAIGTAPAVVHLAHGGGLTNREIHTKLVGAAQVVAQACLEARAERLIFVSSIAALYLGNRREVITGFTEADRCSSLRAPYAEAKAEAERLLLSLYRNRALPVCILRPGIVIGDGGLPFHSGVGLFVAERHCMGWNRGDNPLPLVLASDVADAVVRSLGAPNVEGRSFNLVGDVRLTAREYIDELSEVLGRPLRFHPQSVYKAFLVELGKHLVKRIVGGSDARQTLYDLRSRGLVAVFDCTDARRDLGWHPVADRHEFLRAGLGVHGSEG